MANKTSNLRLRLTLEVEYDRNGEGEDALRHRLEQVVKDAVGNGTLTGDGPATVEQYEYDVRRAS